AGAAKVTRDRQVAEESRSRSGAYPEADMVRRITPFPERRIFELEQIVWRCKRCAGRREGNEVHLAHQQIHTGIDGLFGRLIDGTGRERIPSQREAEWIEPNRTCHERRRRLG